MRRPCCAERQARSSKGFAGRIGIAPTSASQRVEAADTVKDFRCASGAGALLTAHGIGGVGRGDRAIIFFIFVFLFFSICDGKNYIYRLYA